ncbi:MAG: VCBS repeat-containing protein [Deltaproteobacteria bacterium]|nr:VCBS repeat-containing protein [Deltaproteobacteria bacterium]
MRHLSPLLLATLIASGCSCGATKAGNGSSSGSTGASGSNGSSGSTGGTCSGAAPLCTLQHGVCSGSHAHCTNGAWQPCDASDYGSNYSPTESTCDGLDHNCDGTPSGTVACGASCCPTGDLCVAGSCVVGGSGCTSDGACQSDTHCVGGHCVPWGDGGFDPTCSHPITPAHFSPSIRCAWPGTQTGFADPDHVQVITTPLVADFHLYPDAHPMVVFPTQNSLGGGAPECVGDATDFGLIRVLDPQSCTVVATLDAADQHVIGSSTPAIGDLDGDGNPDIVAAAVGGGLVAFHFNTATQAWETLWHSTDPSGNPSTLNSGGCMWGGPSIADVDGDGLPEVVFGGVIHDHTGKIIGQSLGMQSYSNGIDPVLADVDLDGGPELVTGNGLFSYDPTARDFVAVPSFAGTTLANGFTAVARFGSWPVAGQPDPGYPQIAVVSAGQVRVQTLDGTVVFGPYALPGSSGGGPPTIGDFNGDGQPDIAAAGSDSFTVFSFHCLLDGGALPSDCQSEGILWSKPSQDHSSNITGSSLFDFTGGGRVNGVYADECFTRVYDGPTGQVIYSQWHSSCTWYENPVVADVLANYSSQLVVGSNQNCNVDCTGSTEDDGTGRRVDIAFEGLTCVTADDCPAVSDTCVGGLCRCTSDDGCCGNAGQCPSEGFVCAPPPASGDPASGNTCRAVHNGSYAGVRIYADGKNRWADSRSIWNQHAYAVTNVNDDGTIPSMSAARHNWLVSGLDNFRQNVQGQLTPLAAAHLTIDFTNVTCVDGGATLDFQGEVCNRGAGGVAGDVPVQFDDAQGNPICSTTTPIALGAGACVQVGCFGTSPDAGTAQLVAVVDPTGATRPCDGAQNDSTLTGFACFSAR